MEKYEIQNLERALSDITHENSEKISKNQSEMDPKFLQFFEYEKQTFDEIASKMIYDGIELNDDEHRKALTTLSAINKNITSKIDSAKQYDFSLQKIDLIIAKYKALDNRLTNENGNDENVKFFCRRQNLYYSQLKSPDYDLDIYEFNVVDEQALKDIFTSHHNPVDKEL